jgi:hypothetical protein
MAFYLFHLLLFFWVRGVLFLVCGVAAFSGISTGQDRTTGPPFFALLEIESPVQ